MQLIELKRTNTKEIDIVVIPEGKIIGRLLLEETIKYPGDIVVINERSYITVEKTNHYYYDGAKYKFAKTVLNVKSLETFH